MQSQRKRSGKAQEREGGYDLPGHGCRHAANPPPSPASPSYRAAAAQKPCGSPHSRSLPPAQARRWTRGGEAAAHGVRRSRERRRAADRAGSRTQPAGTSAAPKGSQNKLAEWKGSGEARKTYVLATGVLDVQASPAPCPPVAVAPREGSRQVPAKAPEANGRVLLGEPPSTHERARGKKRWRLQLHGLKDGQSIGRGVRQALHMAEAIVLVGAYDTSQQVDPAQVFVLRRGIGLLRLLIVAFLVIAVTVVVVVVVVVVIVLAHVNIAVARTRTGSTRSTRGTGRKTTAS